MLMKPIAAVFVLFCAFVPAALRAENAPVVVELFTSQGCSSCPPADALMRKLADRDDVIGLALHVDYWDYLGWKDEFASPSNTIRQKGYAHSGGRTMIYTPQMVIMGQEDVVGAHAMELMDLIEQHRAAPRPVSISAQRRDDQVVIQLERVGDVSVSGPFEVHLVRFTPHRQVQITRGELAGHDLEYSNVVDEWTVLGRWDGRGPAELRGDLSGSDRPAVVLVQRPNFGPIVAAVRTDD